MLHHLNCLSSARLFRTSALDKLTQMTNPLQYWVLTQMHAPQRLHKSVHFLPCLPFPLLIVTSMLEMEMMEMETMIRWHHVCHLYVQSNDLSDFGASFTAKNSHLTAPTYQAKSRLSIPTTIHSPQPTHPPQPKHTHPPTPV